jgi:hypothetical protein
VGVGARKTVFFPPVLKIPGKFPVALLVKVCMREDKALRSEKVNF